MDGYIAWERNIYVFSGDKFAIEVMTELLKELLEDQCVYVTEFGFHTYMSGKKLVIVPPIDSEFNDKVILCYDDINSYVNDNTYVYCQDIDVLVVPTFKILICNNMRNIECVDKNEIVSIELKNIIKNHRLIDNLFKNINDIKELIDTINHDI